MHSETEKIFKIMPSLRKYAHALSGIESTTDDLLQSAIEWMQENSILDEDNYEAFGILGCRIAWLDKQSSNKADFYKEDELCCWPVAADAIEVSHLVSTLPIQQQRCLLSSALENKSYAEIAVGENISKEQVAELISASRLSLVAHLFAENDCSDQEFLSFFGVCSAQHVSALLDNELPVSEASKIRSSVKLNKDAARKLQQLAMIDTLIVASEELLPLIPVQITPYTDMSLAQNYLH